MIVHLFDDEKFVDTTIDKFEKLSPGENRYIVFSGSQVLKFPKKIDKIDIHTDKWYKLNFDDIFRNCDLLIIHYLTPLKSYILKKAPKEINILWIVWGGDAYSNFRNFSGYEPKTKLVVDSFFKVRIRNTIFYDIFHLYKYGVRILKKETKILSKVNYMATVLPPEFEVINKEFNLKAKFVKFNYDSLNDVLKKTTKTNLGGNILLGNSATAYNNHLDAFDKIKTNKFTLVVPLNYGDKSYRDIICKEGTALYGNKFKPIIDFLPFDEYEKLVSSCNTMIMYHIRQQGLGNIFLALFTGMRVYLNKKSITYDYLTSIGLRIYNLEDHIELLGIELEEETKSINKQLIKDYWGEEKILEGTNNIIELYKSLKGK